LGHRKVSGSGILYHEDAHLLSDTYCRHDSDVPRAAVVIETSTASDVSSDILCRIDGSDHLDSCSLGKAHREAAKVESSLALFKLRNSGLVAPMAVELKCHPVAYCIVAGDDVQRWSGTDFGSPIPDGCLVESSRVQPGGVAGNRASLPTRPT
jgi:hypothetical protein